MFNIGQRPSYNLSCLILSPFSFSFKVVAIPLGILIKLKHVLQNHVRLDTAAHKIATDRVADKALLVNMFKFMKDLALFGEN